MNQTSIIVYSNPVEKLFWEGIREPYFWLFLFGLIAFVATYAWIEEKVRGK